jgi:creatinine amidohydrolase/Fe(II)-dependent formamide hydrolase-like protein
MKNYFLSCLAVLMTLTVSAQPTQKPTDSAAPWYALLTYEDGFTDEFVLHLDSKNGVKTAVIDIPLKNIGVIWRHEPFLQISATKTVLENNRISCLFPSIRLDFEGAFNPAGTELTGELYVIGKPYKIIFTKEKKTVGDKNPTYIEPLPGLSEKDLSPDSEMKRTIEAPNTLFTEELNWMEIRDAIRTGKTTIIIPTGGVEMNGRYLASGKHNFVLRVAADSIARRLGNALIAPIVPFVPEGGHSPKTGHMRYTGTISLTEATFEKLLKEIALSYKMHGFKTIIFIGDSGGNQWGMYVAAKELREEWKNESINVLFIPEYYENYRVAQWLKTQGIKEKDSGMHDSFQYTSQIMALNPTLVRAQERIKEGEFSINGVNLLPVEKTIEMGKKLAGYQAEVTVEAIRKALKNK